MFLKNRNVISKNKILKVTDYAALIKKTGYIHAYGKTHQNEKGLEILKDSALLDM